MSRVEKVTQALKKEISNIIHEELKDPRVGFVTVTRLEMSRDLRWARIYYSVLGDSGEKENTKVALENASGFIRKQIGQRLKLRLVPEIVFKEDKSIEYSIHLQEEIDKLKKSYESKKGHRTDK